MEPLALRLHSAAIHLLRRLRTEDEASGIGPARLSALSVLVFGGERSLGELAAAEQVRPPTMTRIVSGLERDGLAERHADAGDRRAIRVGATIAGRELLEAARARRIDRLLRLLEPLSAAELEAMEVAVAALERGLRDSSAG